MLVTPFTTPIVRPNDNLESILKQAFQSLPEKSVVAITSKIVALCEGNVADLTDNKTELVQSEADYYLDIAEYNTPWRITIKNSTLAVNAGIDESNASGYFVKLPRDSQASANQIWQFLRREYNVKELGVIVTDSKTFPLKWGTMGTCLAHSGFMAVNDKRGEKDLFGHEMRVTHVNVSEALAAAAVLEMGEVAESSPLALIENIRDIIFQDREPSAAELEYSNIDPKEDVYAPLLTAVKWQKGGHSK